MVKGFETGNGCFIQNTPSGESSHVLMFTDGFYNYDNIGIGGTSISMQHMRCVMVFVREYNNCQKVNVGSL